MKPIDKGANLKDMQRAMWINHELHKKAYFGFDQADDSEEEQIKDAEEDKAVLELDPEFILAQKREAERIKEYEEFITKIHLVFDPISFICKETSNLSEDKKTRV